MQRPTSHHAKTCSTMDKQRQYVTIPSGWNIRPLALPSDVGCQTVFRSSAFGACKNCFLAFARVKTRLGKARGLGVEFRQNTGLQSRRLQRAGNQ